MPGREKGVKQNYNREEKKSFPQPDIISSSWIHNKNMPPFVLKSQSLNPPSGKEVPTN